MVNEIYSAITGYNQGKNKGSAMRHYHQAAIVRANGVQLIVALYDAFLRFLTQAAAPAKRATIARREAARRALNIVIHLQASLRMDLGGASAERLSDFYAAVFAESSGPLQPHREVF